MHHFVRFRRLAIVLGLFAVAILSARTVYGQSAEQIGVTPPNDAVVRPIGDFLVDTNGDRIPDAVGSTITIAGRATVTSGQLHRNWTEVFVQDETGGIKIVASSAAPTIVAGDSLIVRGRLDHELGMAQLTDPAYRKVDTPSREPEPLEVSAIDELGLEPYEGQLIEVKGTVAARIPNEGGDNLVLLVGDQLLIAFAYANRTNPISFEEYKVGQYVRVLGIAGQFDRRAPYNASYQLFPRTASDIQRAGFSPTWYRNAAILVGFLLFIVLAWAWLLRRQIRKRVSQLQVSEIRYGQLFNAAGDCVFVYENTKNGWIIDANLMAERTLGYTPTEFRRLTLKTLATPDYADKVAEHLIRAEDNGGSLSVIDFRTKSDGIIPFEIRTHKLDLEGVPAFLSIARDVSQRRAFEQGLIEAKRQAEEMAHLKSAFFINMSHEIRTPLTAIIGAAELLMDEVGDDQKEFAELIEHGGKRLLGTLNSVLDLAQLDSGELDIKVENVEANQLVNEIVDSYRSAASEKGLEIYVETTDPNLPSFLDVAAITRVLGNILDNAIKFTDDGGIRVKIASEDAALQVHIADTGIGMNEEFIPHLFTEFKQESEGFARTYEGNGLGLAIAHRLVDLMGGQIRVLSRKGVGSMFIVSLPRAPGQGLTAAGRPPVQASTVASIASGIAVS